MVNLCQLPNEVVLVILHNCFSPDLAAMAVVSKHYTNLANEVLYTRNARDENAVAMLWAAKHGRIGTLEHLVRCGASVNETTASLFLNREDPLYEGWIDKIVPRGVLAEYEPNTINHFFNFSPLAVAVAYGQDLTVRWLLKHGARVDMPTKNLCNCTVYEDSDQFWTPLHIAICNRHTSTAKLLLSNGANADRLLPVTYQSYTALHGAADMSNHELIEHMVVHKYISYIDDADVLGYTALHKASVQSPNFATIKKLVELGASVDVESMDSLLTPFAHFCSIGNFRMALYFVQNGADFDFVVPGWPVTPRQIIEYTVEHFFPAGVPPWLDHAAWESDRDALVEKIREIEMQRNVVEVGQEVQNRSEEQAEVHENDTMREEDSERAENDETEADVQVTMQ